MRRVLVIEKRNDILRQFWITNELEWPEDKVLVHAIITELVRTGIIGVVKYSSTAKLVPWLYTYDLFDKNESPLPAEIVFPYPMANITSERELDGYNTWLTTDFVTHVMKMNNSVRVVPGWENINYKHIFPLKPKKLIIQDFEFSRAETFASYGISENSVDCCE